MGGRWNEARANIKIVVIFSRFFMPARLSRLYNQRRSRPLAPSFAARSRPRSKEGPSLGPCCWSGWPGAAKRSIGDGELDRDRKIAPQASRSAGGRRAPHCGRCAEERGVPVSGPGRARTAAIPHSTVRLSPSRGRITVSLDSCTLRIHGPFAAPGDLLGRSCELAIVAARPVLRHSRPRGRRVPRPARQYSHV